VTGPGSWGPGYYQGVTRPEIWYQAAADAREKAGQPPTSPTGGGGGRGGGTTRPRNPAPAGIDQKWWDDFTKEHAGQNPAEFYQEAEGVSAAEGIRRAQFDREFGASFRDQYGRDPTEDDWKAHYFATRGGDTRSEAEKELDRMKRRRWRIKRKDRLAKWRREKYGKKPEQTEDRPPLYIPPSVYWRL
jgi:hypothetical protein